MVDKFCFQQNIRIANIIFKFMCIENTNSIFRLILRCNYLNPAKAVKYIRGMIFEGNDSWKQTWVEIYITEKNEICENLSCLSMAISVLQFHKLNIERDPSNRVTWYNYVTWFITAY